MIARYAAIAWVLLLMTAESRAAAATNGNGAVERCRAQASVDVCYDAIRRSPSDPALLVALGDALLRANRTSDALRTYRRAAALNPAMPGVATKISATEAKMSAKRPSGNSSHGGSADAGSGKRYSNAAPETQSH
jgi:predicted Zn-dependent protease